MKHIPKFDSFMNETVTTVNNAEDYMSYMNDVKKSLTKSSPGRSYSITGVEVDYAKSDDASGNGEGAGRFVFTPSPVDVEFDYTIKFSNTKDEEADIDIEINFAPESNGYKPTSSKHSLKKQHVPDFPVKLNQIFKEELAKFTNKQ